MNTFNVTVTMELAEGCTAADAEIGEEEAGSRLYEGITALDVDAASERALDKFHDEVGIGVLDCVVITTDVRRAGRAVPHLQLGLA